MSFIEEFKKKIFRSHAFSFNELALELFQYQVKENPVYREYAGTLDIKPSQVVHPEQIPFLPVELFKKHRIVTGSFQEKEVFESSGTTGTRVSSHYVADPGLYVKSFRTAFEMFFGRADDKVILALLPSYLEQEHSSLIYMVRQLIEDTGSALSGFYMRDHQKLLETIGAAKDGHKRILLVGVSFALLELAEHHPVNLSGHIVMETGGMKGRRREMVREELHNILREGFQVSSVASEYGMTELMSQAYAKEDGRFNSPPWMKVLIRDPYDPFTFVADGESGGLNIIDLANMHSCSFIATQDIGRKHPDGQFEVLGRFDYSDLRGCNLMAL